MNTKEVAEYLRLKERKVYDLVAHRQIPCTRVAGKWLFPRDLIDSWLRRSIEGLPPRMPYPDPPPIVAGSHDPLLDWAVRESGSGLALLFGGSLDGLERFARGEAAACGLHVFDPERGQYNVPLIEQRFGTEPVVLIEWAQREQGLIVATGNPLGITSLAEAAAKRLAIRQKESGSYLLLDHLLKQNHLALCDFVTETVPLRSETEVAMAVAAGQADVGLGIAGATQQLPLDFVPLAEERYDLLVWRRSYFEPPLQRLLRFVNTPSFAEHARTTTGYRFDGLGHVHFNGP
jgi:excisionase family DNA binding protein